MIIFLALYITFLYLIYFIPSSLYLFLPFPCLIGPPTLFPLVTPLCNSLQFKDEAEVKLHSCDPKNLSTFLGAEMVKNLPATWETRVRSLGWEDPLEKGMAIHSSILAWRIPWTEDTACGVAESWTRLSD